jgi:hypothetical protein
MPDVVVVLIRQAGVETLFQVRPDIIRCRRRWGGLAGIPAVPAKIDGRRFHINRKTS